MFFAFIAAISNAFEVIISKEIFSKFKIGHKDFTAISMTSIFLITCVPAFVFGYVDIENLRIFHLLFFLIIIALAFTYNLLYFYSLRGSEVCDVEPFALLHHPLAIVFAFIVFPDERNIWILVFTLIASLSLLTSRIEKHHLNLNKYFYSMVLFTVLISVEAIFAKMMLEVFNPFALYAFRTGVLSILVLTILKPNIRKLGVKRVSSIFFKDFFTVSLFIFYYYAISTVGIMKSSLIMIIAPVIVLFVSKIMLKENLTLKKAIADVVIVICAISVVLLS